MEEFDLIERYFRPLAQNFPGAFSLNDDAASIAVPHGEDAIVTTDMLLEGVHFFGKEPANLIAKKALRTNLSDLAAKAAKPLCYFLNIGLSDNVDEAWVALFAKGLAEDQAEFGISLAGGDTTHCRAGLIISITAVGTTPKGKMVRRYGAKANDLLCVSGTIGDAALGLAILKQEYPDMPKALRQLAIDRYHVPQPRISLGLTLRDVATSAMDISDGLFQDLGHLLKASGVGACLELDALPLSPAMQWLKENHPARWLELISSGDDYELLFTAQQAAPEGATRIGMITSGNNLRIEDGAGKVVTPSILGYRHRPGRDVGP